MLGCNDSTVFIDNRIVFTVDIRKRRVSLLKFFKSREVLVLLGVASDDIRIVSIVFGVIDVHKRVIMDELLFELLLHLRPGFLQGHIGQVMVELVLVSGPENPGWRM